MTLAYTRLSATAQAPSRAHEGDAGLDLHADEAVKLPPGERVSVATGIAVSVPPGCGGLVLPRSGLADRHGIALVNAPGLIDPGYRGEVRVLLLNTDRETTFDISVGDRIAQLLVVRLEAVEPEEVGSLTETARGGGGFGSTGGFGASRG
ncbi:MAG TPA: dUTP diphosphatase [Thermoleophilaceae bacterium]|nr:dUTP diphosphatase [Thermoleophilaceae bacterium]